MSGKRGLSDDELEVWTSVTRSIKPLKAARGVAKPETSQAPAVPPRKIKANAVAKPAAAPVKLQAGPAGIASLSRREKQRVSRGHDRIDARLDLHGHTQSQAHAALLRFLRGAAAGDMRLVLVITGKSGVLRQQVPMWLATPEFRGLVASTSPAAINHGGDGALYIRVRRSRG